MQRIRNALVRRPELVFWLIGAYYAIAVIVRVLRSEGLQTDEAEQLFQSQFLLMGYGRQPPFYNWLQYGAVQLFGPSIFALSIVKNLLLFLSCVFYGLAARSVLQDRVLSSAAMLGVLALPAVTVLAQRDLTHAVATMFSVSLFLYAYLRTLTRPSLWGYVLTGIAVGIGAISKYNFVIVPLAAVLAILPEAELRKRLFDWRVLPALLVAAAICLPHGLWALHNVDTATSGTLDAMREDSTGNAILDRLHGVSMLVVSAVTSSLTLLAFFALAFHRDLKAALRAGNVWSRVVGRAFLISLIMIGLISIGLGATTISQKWLSPFLLLLPLYLCLKLEAAGADSGRGISRLVWPVSILAFGFVLYLVAGNLAAPFLGRYQKESLPGVPFIQQVIASRGDRPEPGYILTADPALAASARLAAPKARVLMPAFTQAPALDDAARALPGLLVWKIGAADKAMPDALRDFAAGQGIAPDSLVALRIDVPYHFSGGRDTTPFGYAWVNGR
jgi:4-amino-4-deoxy-L-arabinose transferase-like glycosyltransferase